MDQETEVAGPEIRAPWRMLRHGTTKVAFSLSDLVTLTSDFSVKWAHDCNSQVIRTDKAKHLFVYRVTCHKKKPDGTPESDPRGHVVRLKFDFDRMKATGTVDNLDVRLTCSCPAFLYWGAQWNLGAADTLYGAPRPKYQPPTDPKRYLNTICKHCKIVADRIGPALERLLGQHRDVKDRAEEDQNQKDVALEKQRAQQTVEDLTQETQQPVPDTTPQNPNAPELKGPSQVGPVKTYNPPPKTAPEDLGDLTMPGQPPVPPLPPAPPPAPPKPSPEALLPPKTRDTLGLPPVPAVAPGSKGRLVAPNITLYDEDEGPTTVLPGAKGKLVMDQKPHPNVFVHDDEDEGAPTILPGRRPKVIRDETTRGRKLPPTMTLHDDDEDETVRINSSLRRLAGLVMAAAEPVPAGRFGALIVAGPGRLGQLVVAERGQTSGPTS